MRMSGARIEEDHLSVSYQYVCIYLFLPQTSQDSRPSTTPSSLSFPSIIQQHPYAHSCVLPRPALFGQKLPQPRLPAFLPDAADKRLHGACLIQLHRSHHALVPVFEVLFQRFRALGRNAD